MIRAFVENPKGKPEDYRAFYAMENVKSGKPLGEYENLFDELFYPDGYNNGIVRQMGYLFDFRGYFKPYIVEFKHYGFRRVYAPNKTHIRKLSCHKSWIIKITEE
jgi:hypothetical protein